MKRFIALTATAICLTAAAHAEPTVQVAVPADLTSAESIEAYTASLDAAVVSVCRRASSPMIGTNYYRFQACLKDTRAQVSANEPTGVYARATGTPVTVAVATR